MLILEGADRLIDGAPRNEIVNKVTRAAGDAKALVRLFGALVSAAIGVEKADRPEAQIVGGEFWDDY